MYVCIYIYIYICISIHFTFIGADWEPAERGGGRGPLAHGLLRRAGQRRRGRGERRVRHRAPAPRPRPAPGRGCHRGLPAGAGRGAAGGGEFADPILAQLGSVFPSDCVDPIGKTCVFVRAGSIPIGERRYLRIEAAGAERRRPDQQPRARDDPRCDCDAVSSALRGHGAARGAILLLLLLLLLL